MEVRLVTLPELESVGEIAKSAFLDYSKEDYKKMAMDKNYVFYVAVQDGNVVGFVNFLHIDDKLEIIKIATHEQYRRKGIAEKLINAVKNYAVINNHVGIILEVNEKNEPARNLYKKMGFNEIHIRKKYYSNSFDAIIMEWLI